MKTEEKDVLKESPLLDELLSELQKSSSSQCLELGSALKPPPEDFISKRKKHVHSDQELYIRTILSCLNKISDSNTGEIVEKILDANKSFSSCLDTRQLFCKIVLKVAEHEQKYSKMYAFLLKSEILPNEIHDLFIRDTSTTPTELISLMAELANLNLVPKKEYCEWIRNHLFPKSISSTSSFKNQAFSSSSASCSHDSVSSHQVDPSSPLSSCPDKPVDPIVLLGPVPSVNPVNPSHICPDGDSSNFVVENIIIEKIAAFILKLQTQSIVSLRKSNMFSKMNLFFHNAEMDKSRPLRIQFICRDVIDKMEDISFSKKEKH